MAGDIKGLTVNGAYLRIQFTWHDKRYRVTTNFKPGQEKQAARLLAAILFDLENNRFNIEVYRTQLRRIHPLLSLDSNYIKDIENPVMSSLFDTYLLQLKDKLDSGIIQVGTHRAYSYVISKHLMPKLGKLRIDQVTISVIEEFINSLGLTRKRLGAILVPLRDIFRKLQRQGLIENNPLINITSDSFTRVIKTDYEVEPFTLDEIEQIIKNCDHECVANIIKFGFWTGMRISEIFALNWGDIDFDNETISVSKSQTLNKQLKSPKTKSGTRLVEMTPAAKEALLAQSKLTANKERVFLNPTGKIWSKPDNLGRYWRMALSAANIKYRNPYQMRHTFISMMLQFGNSPLVLYKMVGHTNSEMIYKNYARFIKQEVGKKILKIF